MAATKVSRAERELRIREFVETSIAETGLLPTVARTIEACGGSTSTVGPLLREYRVPGARRRDERTPQAARHADRADYARTILAALELAEEMDPIIRTGTHGPVDAADDIRAAREEQDR